MAIAEPSYLTRVSSSMTTPLPYTSYATQDIIDTSTIPAESERDIGEIDTEDLTRGDTSIVQNNFNLKLTTYQMIRENGFWVIVGTLLLVALVLGIIVLGIILGRLLDKEDDNPMIVVPPPGANIKWTHDPIFEMPQGYKQQTNNKDTQQFSEQSLHPPKHQ